jgi:predicted ATP-grasp superfamily ATP-dependent carboligase
VELDTRVPAVVLRFDRNVFHHGTLGVIRSLGRAGVEVHAVLEGRGTPASRSRFLRATHRCPVPGDGPRHEGDPGELAAALNAIAGRIGRRAVLVPVDDVGAIFVAENADRLAAGFLLPGQDPGLPRRLADKAALTQACTSLGLPQPESRIPRTREQAADAVAALGLPLMAKWTRPWLLERGSGLRSTSLVGTAAAVLELFDRVRPGGSPLLLQRYLPPSPEADWFFHGYFDASSACLFGGAGRKDRAYPHAAGLTTLGTWLPNPAVEGIARRLAGHVGYRGILDIDLRYDAEAGHYHVVDFNPRLGAQFRLFAADGGLDLVRALHLDLTGRPVPPSRPAVGRAYLVENYDLLPAVHRRDAGGLRRWLRSVRGADELAWFARDDLAPFAAMTAHSLTRGLRRRTAGGRAAAGG